MRYTREQIIDIRRRSQSCAAMILRRIFSGILITNERDSGRFRCACPVHNGSDANVDYIPYDGMFYCHSHCGSMNILQLIQRALQLTKIADAAVLVAEILGYSSTTNTQILLQYKPQDNRPLLRINEKELENFREYHKYWDRIPEWVRFHMEGGYCNNNKHLLYGRITFPVRDFYGNLVGVSARCVSEEAPSDAHPFVKESWYRIVDDNKIGSKYRNWGANSLSRTGRPIGGFTKSKVLLHAHVAKYYRDRPLLIVEGPFDVANAVAHGWFATVGIFGSMLSEDQWKIITTTHKHIIYGLDPDTFVQQNSNMKSKYEKFCEQANRHNIIYSTIKLRSGADIGSLTRKEFDEAIIFALQDRIK